MIEKRPAMLQSKNMKSIFSKTVLLLLSTSLSFSLSYAADPNPDRNPQRRQAGINPVVIPDDLWSGNIPVLTWVQRLENFRAQLIRAALPHEDALKAERLKRVAVVLELPEAADTIQDRVEVDLQAGIVDTFYHLLDLLDPDRYVYDPLRVQHLQTSLISQLYRLGRFRYEIAAEYVELARRFTSEAPPEREGPLEVSAVTVAVLPRETQEFAKRWLDYIINRYHLRNNGDIPQIFNEIIKRAQGRLYPQERDLAGFLSESHLMQLEYLRAQRLGLPASIEFGLPYLLPFQDLSSTMPYAASLRAFIEEGWLTKVITPDDRPQIERFYQQFSRGLEYQRIGEFIRTVLSPLEDIAAAPLGKGLTDEGIAFICSRLYLAGAATVFDRIPKTLFQREESREPQNNVDLLRRFIPFTQLRNIALVLHNANQPDRARDRELIQKMLNPLVAALKDLLPYMRQLIKDEVISINGLQQSLRFNLEERRAYHEDAFGRIKRVGQFGSDIAIFSKLFTTLDGDLLNQFRKPLAEWSPKLKKAFVRIFVMLGESSKNLSNRSKLLAGSDRFWEKFGEIRDGIVHPSADMGKFSPERLEIFLNEPANNVLLQRMLEETASVLTCMRALYDSEEFTIESVPDIAAFSEDFGEHIQAFFDQVRSLEIPPRGIPVRNPELIDITRLTFEPRVNADVIALDNTFNFAYYQDQLAALQALVRAYNFDGDFDALVESLPLDDGKKQEIRATRIRYQNLRTLIAEMIVSLEAEPITATFTEAAKGRLKDFLTSMDPLVEVMADELRETVGRLPDKDAPAALDEEEDEDDPFAGFAVLSDPHPLKEQFEEFVKRKKALIADIEKCMALDLKQSYETFRDELLGNEVVHESLEKAAAVDSIEEAIEKETAVRENIMQQLKRFRIQQQHVDLWFSELKKYHGLLLNPSNQRKRALQRLFNSTLRLEDTLIELQHTTEDARKGDSVADIKGYWNNSTFCLALEDDFEDLRHKVGGLSSNLDSLYEIHPAIAAMLQFHLENLRRLGNDLGHLGDVYGFSTQNEEGKRYYLRRTLKILMGETPKGSISFIEALQSLRADLNQAIAKNDSVMAVSVRVLPTARNGDILECIPIGAEPSRHFTLDWIDPDGNCGFNALGISRGDAITQLLAHSNDETIRAAVAEDIRQALLQGHLPLMMRKAEANGLRVRYFHIQNQIDGLRRQLGNIAPDVTVEELQGEILLIQVANPQRAGLLERLQQTINDQIDLDQRIRDYAQHEETYRQFIREEFGRGAWLSYVRGGRGTLYALASINNLNVHIWQQNATGQLEEIPLAPGLVGAERNLLHTDGLTHFHQLL